MAGEVLSSTSNYTKAHVDAYIRKKLVSLGNDRALIAKFAQQETQPKGMGDTIRFLQMNPLDLPVSQLTEATDPSKTSSAISYVEATMDHWGVIVGVSERLQMFSQFDVLSKHVELVGRLVVRKREQEHVDVALAGTNVIYAGNATSRATLDSSDTFTTTEIRKAIMNLFRTDGAKGETPRYPDGKLVCILDADLLMDLQSDTTWDTALTRQAMGKLQDDPLMVTEWQGVRFYAANLFPQWDNLGDATDVAYGIGITANNSPGGATLGDYIAVVVTRKHKKRLFEEDIFIVNESNVGDGGDDNSVTVNLGSADEDYLYNIYVGDDGDAAATARANLALSAHENVAAGSSYTVTASPSGAAPPVVWTADGAEKIRAALFMGPEFLAVAKLQMVSPHTVPGPDSGNVLQLFTDIGAKWRDKAVITDEDYGVRVEAHTSQ